MLGNPRPRRFTTFQAVFVGGITFVVFSVVIGMLYIRSRGILEHELKNHLRTNAAVAALLFHGMPLEQIKSPADMQTPLYRDIDARLQQIRATVPNIRFVYILRRTADPMILEFVADSDAARSDEERDVNKNGITEESEEASVPGLPYDISDVPTLQSEAFLHPAVDEEVTTDQWGTWLSGYAPIENAEGEVVATLGLDMAAEDYLLLSRSVFSPMFAFLVVLAGCFLVILITAFIRRHRLGEIHEIEIERSSLIDLALHQLGTPIATFRWWLEILRDRDTHQKLCHIEGKGNICDEMEAGLSRMSGMIQAMREANQIGLGMSYRLEQASLEEIINAVVAEFHRQITLRNLTVHTDLHDVSAPMALDKKLVAAVVRELIDNAVTYSAPHGSIEVTAKRKMNSVHVDVRDHGCGIPAAEQEWVFQKFMRASNAYKWKPAGNGLGLFTAKGIIERAGGKMWLTSQEGKGTTVTFTLPL